MISRCIINFISSVGPGRGDQTVVTHNVKVINSMLQAWATSPMMKAKEEMQPTSGGQEHETTVTVTQTMSRQFGNASLARGRSLSVR